MQQIQLKIAGMSCNHCKMAVERGLSGLSGVDSAVVNLAEGTVQISYDPATVSTSDLQKAVEEAGYQVVELC
mgnify:CR=1 FL=1